MYNMLQMGGNRRILDANFNYHREGELHPDRILDFHDIVYIVDGSWIIGQDGTAYDLEKGDVIILHAGRHHYGVGGRLPGVRTMYLHMAHLPGDALADAAGVQPPDCTLELPVLARCGDSAAVRSVFSEIISVFWSEKVNKDFRLSALCDLLLLEIHEAGSSGESSSDKLVDEALSLIRLTPERILTLSELACALHVCSRSLSGKFRRATGKSVHQYELGLKLDMARMYIRSDPGRPFKDVAANLGFYDEFHFSRAFKQKYGVSPIEFKMRMGIK